MHLILDLMVMSYCKQILNGWIADVVKGQIIGRPIGNGVVGENFVK